MRGPPSFSIRHVRDFGNFILYLQYAATAMHKNFLHIAGHHLYNIVVGSFCGGVRAGEGSAGGILFFESKGIQLFFMEADEHGKSIQGIKDGEESAGLIRRGVPGEEPLHLFRQRRPEGGVRADR
jgi:hypothetical protein